MSSGPSLSFRRVGDSLVDASGGSRQVALAEAALREADEVRAAILARPGGFSEDRPIVVDFHVSPDGVVVDWVRGDYATTRGIGKVAASHSLRAGSRTDGCAPRWLGLGAMGLNVTVRTADDMTAVAVRAANMANGGLAHVAMNEGLNAVDVPDSALGDVVPFDLVSATRRGLVEELGLELPARVSATDVGLRVDTVFEVVGHGLAVSAHVDLTQLGVTSADLLCLAAAAPDAWERDALYVQPVRERQPSVRDVLAYPVRYSAALAASVGAAGATPWSPLCFASAGLWPAS